MKLPIFSRLEAWLNLEGEVQAPLRALGLKAIDSFSRGGSLASWPVLRAGQRLQFPTPPLLPEEIKEMEGIHCYVPGGHGELEGELVLLPVSGSGSAAAVRSSVTPGLVTYRGERLEIAYQLDLPLTRAIPLVGQRVRVEADFLRDGVEGTGRGAKISEVLGKAKLESGDVVALKGRVQWEAWATLNAPPDGNYLLLSKPLAIGGKRFESVFLEGGEKLSKGQEIELTKEVFVDPTNEDSLPVARVRLTDADTARFHRRGDPPRPLTQRELELVSDIYIGAMEGTGTLQGQLICSSDPADPSVRLITSRCGRSEKAFRVDLPLSRAQALDGQTVQIKGVIFQGGKEDHIEQAQVREVVPPEPTYELGAQVTVAGIAYQRTDTTRSPPAPTTQLVLPKPIIVDGKRVQELVLVGAGEIPDKTKLRVDGTVHLQEVVDTLGRTHRTIELRGPKNFRQATDLPMFYVDAETMINDFAWYSAERQPVVVPKQ